MAWQNMDACEIFARSDLVREDPQVQHCPVFGGGAVHVKFRALASGDASRRRIAMICFAKHHGVTVLVIRDQALARNERVWRGMCMCGAVCEGCI